MSDLRTAAQQVVEAYDNKGAEMTTITIDRAVVEQALEALESSETTVQYEGFGMARREAERKHQAAITALRAALAQQDEPVEPVAWRWGYRSVTTGEMDWRGYVEIAAHPNLRSPEIIMEPLYTAPPQRKPLTDEEILLAAGWERAEMYMKLIPNFPVDEAKQETLKNARAVEKASWEKNNG